MTFSSSVPQDVLFGLQLRAAHEPEHAAGVADDRGPAKAGSDVRIAAVLAANDRPP
jgi:hypothetical protein